MGEECLKETGSEGNIRAIADLSLQMLVAWQSVIQPLQVNHYCGLGVLTSHETREGQAANLFKTSTMAAYVFPCREKFCSAFGCLLELLRTIIACLFLM